MCQPMVVITNQICKSATCLSSNFTGILQQEALTTVYIADLQVSMNRVSTLNFCYQGNAKPKMVVGRKRY